MRGSIPDPPFQFAGRTWYSIPQVAAAYGLPAITVYQRLYLHWPLARALTAPVARRFRVKPRKTPEPFLQEGQWKVQIGSRYFQTAAEVAEVYGLHVNRVYAAIRAADTPEAREYLLQQSVQRKARYLKNRSPATDPLTGKEYPTAADLATAYGIRPRLYLLRLEAGWNPKDALTVPPKARMGRPKKNKEEKR